MHECRTKCRSLRLKTIYASKLYIYIYIYIYIYLNYNSLQISVFSGLIFISFELSTRYFESSSES